MDKQLLKHKNKIAIRWINKCAKDLNKYLTKKSRQISNESTKQYSLSVVLYLPNAVAF